MSQNSNSAKTGEIKNPSQRREEYVPPVSGDEQAVAWLSAILFVGGIILGIAAFALRGNLTMTILAATAVLTSALHVIAYALLRLGRK